jgi:hypothetical protein
MDEQRITDNQLAAIFLEASFRHEQAVAACIDSVGDVWDPADPRSDELMKRALMHAERAAACAADAANMAHSADAQAAARRSLTLDRLAIYALRSLIRDNGAH